MLPSLDGLEVCREIRRRAACRSSCSSARAELHDVIVGLELGADDYVTKPFELPELVARIKAVLRRRVAAPTESVIAVDDLEIDPGRLQRRRRGEERRADGDRVPPAARARTPAEAGVHARAAARARLELRLPRRLAPRRRRRAAAAREDRGRPQGADADHGRSAVSATASIRPEAGARRPPPPPDDHVHARGRRSSAAALAAGLVLRRPPQPLSDSVDSSRQAGAHNLKIAPAYLEARAHDALLEAYERAGGSFETVRVRAGRAFLVELRGGPAPGARRRSARSSVTETSATSGRGSPGTRYLVVGGPSGDTQLYFFFSEQKI